MVWSNEGVGNEMLMEFKGNKWNLEDVGMVLQGGWNSGVTGQVFEGGGVPW